MENSIETYRLMCEQERYGIGFDVAKAKELVKTIDDWMHRIEQDVEPKLPKRKLNQAEIKLYTPPKRQYKKDGTPSATAYKFFDRVYKFGELNQYYGVKDEVKVILPYHGPIIKSLPMQLKHQGNLKNWLLYLGWKPTMWNYKKDKKGKPVRVDGKLVKTSPKFHDKGRLCPGLERLGDKVDLVKPIVTWLSLRNRRSVLLSPKTSTGWLSHPRVEAESRLPASSSGLTNTKRQKHSIVTNVPSVGALLGKEFRELFIPTEGMVFVGVDASGLEARIKGHYTAKYDNGEYAKKLLDPDYDEHSVNAQLWGCTRNQAKSPGYALQYNCQPPKFAETLGVSLKEGKKHYEAYWEHNWALKKAIEETELEFDRNHKKYITTIDGSKVVTRARYSVFNAKCQSTGAKIMDYAGILAERVVRKLRIPAQRVVYYHDEYIYECELIYAEKVKEIIVDSIKESGVYFGLNVPLDANGKIGSSWAEVH